MWNEDTACNITKNEEVIERESGSARLPLVAVSSYGTHPNLKNSLRACC